MEMNWFSILLQSTALERVFFGSGKALVVLAVSATILLGILVWIGRAQIRLRDLESRAEDWEKKSAQK